MVRKQVANMPPKEHVQAVVNDVVDTYWNGDENLKNLLVETAAQESHFGELDSENVMQIDNGFLQDLKKEKYQPALGHLGVFRENKNAEFDTSNLRTNVIIGALRYLTKNPSVPNTKEGRAKLWKDIYNTKKGKGTEAKYLETINKLLR